MISSISSIWFAFELAVSVCAAFVAFYRVKYSSAVIIGALGPSSFSGIPYQCMHYSTMCLCSLFYSMALFSLRVTVLGISFSPTLTAGFIPIYLFYSFIHLFIYVSSTEPSVFRVMGAQGGLGTRLGKPVGCSSTMGCGCSSWALGHLTSICDRGLNLILSYLFIYVFIWNIYTGWLSSALK